MSGYFCIRIFLGSGLTCVNIIFWYPAVGAIHLVRIIMWSGSTCSQDHPVRMMHLYIVQTDVVQDRFLLFFYALMHIYETTYVHLCIKDEQVQKHRGHI